MEGTVIEGIVIEGTVTEGIVIEGTVRVTEGIAGVVTEGTEGTVNCFSGLEETKLANNQANTIMYYQIINYRKNKLKKIPNNKIAKIELLIFKF